MVKCFSRNVFVLINVNISFFFQTYKISGSMLDILKWKFPEKSSTQK